DPHQCALHRPRARPDGHRRVRTLLRRRPRTQAVRHHPPPPGRTRPPASPAAPHRPAPPHPLSQETPLTSAPRIDTVRNRISATRQLLAAIHAELEDVHALPYDRRVAAAAAPVRGSQCDWALYTHVSPNAQAAYRAL